MTTVSHADHYRRIGTTHFFCQDYSSAGSISRGDSTYGYGLVCDGCSTAENSDIGAMLLNKVAETSLVFENRLPPVYGRRLIIQADMHRGFLGVSREALAATLMSVNLLYDGFQVSVMGDGVVVARTRDGVLYYQQITYTSGAPFYLRYTLHEEDFKRYLDQFPGKIHIAYGSIPLGKVQDAQTDEIRPLPSHVDLHAMDLFFPLEIYDLVAVCSDGAASFVQKPSGGASTPVPLNVVLPVLFDFKAYQGEFVKRRCRKAFMTFQERGWANTDDFSIAVVYCG